MDPIGGLVERIVSSTESLNVASRRALRPLVATLRHAAVPDAKPGASGDVASVARVLGVLNADLDSIDAVGRGLQQEAEQVVRKYNKETPRNRSLVGQEDGAELVGQQVLRRWFLDHIRHPFPTKDEKESLLLEANEGLPLKEQISEASAALWFINMRRRSGWTNLHRTYALGSKENMEQLIDVLDEELEAEENEGGSRYHRHEDTLRSLLESFLQAKHGQNGSGTSDRTRRSSKSRRADGPAVDVAQCRADYRALINAIAIKQSERVGDWINEIVEAAEDIRAEDEDAEGSTAPPSSASASRHANKKRRTDNSSSHSYSRSPSLSPASRRHYTPSSPDTSLHETYTATNSTSRFATSSTRQAKSGPLVPTQFGLIDDPETFRTAALSGQLVNGPVGPGSSFSTSSSSSLLLSPNETDDAAYRPGGQRPQQLHPVADTGAAAPYYEFYGSGFPTFQGNPQFDMDHGDTGTSNVSPSFLPMPLPLTSHFLRPFNYTAQPHHDSMI